jgi:hypothetical protein
VPPVYYPLIPKDLRGRTPMVSQTIRTVTTELTCGCTVDSKPGEYATCPKSHPAIRPDHLTRSRRTADR